MKEKCHPLTFLEFHQGLKFITAKIKSIAQKIASIVDKSQSITNVPNNISAVFFAGNNVFISIINLLDRFSGLNTSRPFSSSVVYGKATPSACSVVGLLAIQKTVFLPARIVFVKFGNWVTFLEFWRSRRLDIYVN
jgi:hypothetical protein